jgi:GT2 family glycosyltransferase
VNPSALAVEVRRRLGPPPEMAAWPLVSIVVVNRDGTDRLRRLLRGLTELTDYPNLELILVDNASGDASLEFTRWVDAPFPISIVANPHNESFSDACNLGADPAGGELLLFLNNDAEPFEPGWLRELVACLRASGAGLVGPTLIEPGEAGAGSGYVVHQRGLLAHESAGQLATAYRGQGDDPLGEGLGVDAEAVAVAAACLLISRTTFDRVGGFSHGYMYGPEDVDLALKVRTSGDGARCSGRSILIHPPNTTLKTIGSELRAAWVRGNRRLFLERWGPRLRREYELDRLEGGGLWAEADLDAPAGDGPVPPAFDRAEAEALGYCLRTTESPATASRPLAEIDAALERHGHRCLALAGDGGDDLRALEYDVCVQLGSLDRPVPVAAQLAVLWCVEGTGAVNATKCSPYDLVACDSEDLGRHLQREGLSTPIVVLPGDDLDGRVARLLAAVDSRAQEIAFPTRIECD